MSSLIKYYSLEDWFESTFTVKESNYIKDIIPFFNNTDYPDTNKPLFLALTDCFIDVSFLPNDVWETKIHISVDEKIFDKALNVFYNSDSSILEKHLFYNAVIEKRAFMQSVYDDLLIEKLCNEHIALSEAIKMFLVENNITLGKHEGYSTLVRIYKSRNEKLCKELCNQALQQGWSGSWKRILNSIVKKREQEIAIESDQIDTQIFNKRLPLENEEFRKKYWDKNNIVYTPAFSALENNRNVYFGMFKDNERLNLISISSISFKRGDMYLTLKSGENIKIPMNMVLVDSYIDYNHENFTAIFFGSDKWKVSENSDISNQKYILTTFFNEKDNPLLNKELSRNNEDILRNGISLRMNEEDVDQYVDESEEDNTLEDWNQFFSVLEEKSESELIIVSVFLIDEENNENFYATENQLVSGELKEITVNDEEFSITIDDNTLKLEETIEELQVYFPDQESHTLGYFPCTICIDDDDIRVLIVFASFSNEDIERIKKEKDLNDEENDSDENFSLEDLKKLKYYLTLSNNKKEKFNTLEKLKKMRCFYHNVCETGKELLRRRYSKYHFDESVKLEELLYAPDGYWSDIFWYPDDEGFDVDEYWRNIINQINSAIKNIENNT